MDCSLNYLAEEENVTIKGQKKKKDVLLLTAKVLNKLETVKVRITFCHMTPSLKF